MMRCTQDGLVEGALQTVPLLSDKRYSRKVAFDTYRLSLSDYFKSDIANVSVCTLHIAMHAISISNMYRVSRVACCLLLVASV
jgi:hypothetical protein